MTSVMAACNGLVCLLGVIALGVPTSQAEPQLVRVGRLVSRTYPERAGGERALADYLSAKIPGYTFEFVSFSDPASLIDAAENRKIEFAQVNPSIFVALEVKSEATPIATVVFQLPDGVQLQTLGGVVFCREQERNIQRLEDLRGKRVAATIPLALGGALAVRRELQDLGIRPDRDLKEFRYLGSQQSVIAAVLGGEADCGCAPSNSFATALQNGDLDKNRIRVLPPPQAYPGIREYPIPVSTRLYPASAFVKMRHTPLPLANQMAIALLSVPPGSDMAGRTGNAGWSVALNYEPVRDCLEALGVAPYERYRKVTFAEAIRQHFPKVVIGLLVIALALAGIAGRSILLNRRLRSSQAAVESELRQRKLAEQEREKAEEQLRQSQKLESVGRLAGGVAHDFNNLLTVINGYSLLILGQIGEKDPLRQYVSHILGAGEDAARLTHQLLAFSRKQVVDLKPLNLNTAVTEAEKLLHRVVGEDIQIVTRLDSSLGQVMADAMQIQQVLLNLAVNARDAMPDGGTLLIETANASFDDSYVAGHPEVGPGPYALMAVTDTGTGMSTEVQQHLFEPFYTTKERGKGTGLGLSMVYGIVRHSGGWIWVYSEPGKGSTFKIYLPRIESSVVEEPREISPSVEKNGAGTVLVVEDQPEVRRLTRRALEGYGYRVLDAESGEDALEVARRHKGPIDLLLTDVVLPRMNGRELATQLSLHRPEMKILFTSGYTENVIAHKGVLEPGLAYLPKPFTPNGLAAKIREVLRPPAAE